MRFISSTSITLLYSVASYYGIGYIVEPLFSRIPVLNTEVLHYNGDNVLKYTHGVVEMI